MGLYTYDAISFVLKNSINFYCTTVDSLPALAGEEIVFTNHNRVSLSQSPRSLNMFSKQTLYTAQHTVLLLPPQR